MGQVISKLNLNKTPQLVENNSLIFAKNIRLLKDGSIGTDFDFESFKFNRTTIYDSINEQFDSFDDDHQEAWYGHFANIIANDTISLTVLGIIPYNTSFYLCCIYPIVGESYIGSIILKYEEETNSWDYCDCNWNYSGGDNIRGNVSVGLNGDTILTICESFNDSDTTSLIPIKVINLNKSSYMDDESIYTQTPNINLFNFTLIGKYQNRIPNGVYQFFIRYKIRNDFYTSWFPASAELFAGSKQSKRTNQGGLFFIDTHTNSTESFILQVDKNYVNKVKYEKFQVGFILTSDEQTVARSWKEFDIDTNIIYFSYNESDIKEISIDDILKVNFGLYNVKNITKFKDKLYISNYIESNFNPDLKDFTDSLGLSVEIKSKLINYSNQNDLKILINGVECEWEDITIGGNTRRVIKSIGNSPINRFIYNYLFNLGLTNYSSWDNESNYENASSATPLEPLFDNTINKEIAYGVYDTISAKHTGGFRPYGVPDNPNTTIAGVLKVYNPSTQQYRDININSQNIGFNHQIPTPLTIAAWAMSLITSDLNCIYLAQYSAGNYYRFWMNDNEYISEIKFYYHNSYFADIYIESNLRSVDATFTIEPKVSADNVNTISNSANTVNLLHDKTIIPGQTYEFYIHYIKNNGEITNGYYVDKIYKEFPSTLNGIVQYYPSFRINTIQSLPQGYIGFFFTMCHTRHKQINVFDIMYEGNPGYIGSALEFDTRLILPGNEIFGKCRDDQEEVEIDVSADYHPSQDTTVLDYFGSNGIVRFIHDSEQGDGSSTYIRDYRVFLNVDYEQTANDNLIRCTPFITLSNFTKYEDENEDIIYYYYDNLQSLNLQGYICDVKKLDKSLDTYISGTDKYDKTISSNKITLAKHPWDVNTEYVDSTPYLIYSNYNFNYLSLTDEFTVRIKSLDKNTDQEYIDENKAKDASNAVMLYVTDSINLSDVYELKSMYHTYLRKYYSVYSNDGQIIKFENTVRSSELTGDETSIDIYKFNATDYYNIPTTKGIIINLVSVGNYILVHTEDSLFKFTGNNSLSSQGGEEVQLKETNVFDTGVTEVFGSEFGYAGINKKEHTLLSEAGYVFYDQDANVIYSYIGEGQITPISDPIDKILKTYNITNISFASDYYNDRFFICLHLEDDKFITLSYNYKAKSFISLHDFKFDKSFSTKTNCYLALLSYGSQYTVIERVSKNVCNQTKTSNDNLNNYGDLTFNDTIYPYMDCMNYKTVIVGGHQRLIEVNQGKVSIIDVLINVNYEQIKTLNFIQWVSNEIKSFAESFNPDDDDVKKVMLAEEVLNPYPALYIRIYSDRSASDLIKLSSVEDGQIVPRYIEGKSDRSNEYALNRTIDNEDILKDYQNLRPIGENISTNAYQLARFNLGKWSFNYFRNVLDNTDKTLSGSVSDNKSLLYGKYFVVRFIYHHLTNFKLENVSINYNNNISNQ